MSETIDFSGGIEITRTEPKEYRKTATIKAGQAIRGGVIPTLEGDHTFEEGDYIAGPGAAGEFWPVHKDIFEETYEEVDTVRTPEWWTNKLMEDLSFAAPETWDFHILKRFQQALG